MIGIASSRLWHSSAFDEIEKRTGEPVMRITQEQDLQPSKLAKNKIRKIFFLHWSSIIPPEIYEEFECIIFHMTALPYGRGGSPLQNLILNGHKETLLTAFRCVRELDAGPIYLQRPLELDGPAWQIFERARNLMVDMVEAICRDNPNPIPQSGTAVVFKRRKPEDSNLHLVDNTDQAYDMIRMLDAKGYPHAFLESGGLRFEFTDVTHEKTGLRATVTITKKST